MENNETRTALVTGGAGGIGREICRVLAQDGLRILVADRNIGDCKAVADGLPGKGHMGFAFDVTDEASVAALYDGIAAAGAAVSVLVNCAGILRLRPDGSRNLIADTPVEEWELTDAVNVRGTFLTCREYARRLAPGTRGASVVTISSVAAQLGGYRSTAAYITSKSAILGFTKSMARELAPQGVTVNAVAPGLIATAMLRLSLDPKDDATAAAAVPLGRLGTGEDVANAVSFLVSEKASYITGNTLDVNGGYRMQ